MNRHRATEIDGIRGWAAVALCYEYYSVNTTTTTNCTEILG